MDQVVEFVHAKRDDIIAEDEVGIELHHESIQLVFGFGFEFVLPISKFKNDATACTKVHEEGSMRLPEVTCLALHCE